MSLVQLALCGGIAYMAFCRLNALDATSKATVRWSFSALCVSAVAMAASPWIWGLKESLQSILFQGSIFCVILSMTPAWKNGAPDCVRKV